MRFIIFLLEASSLLVSIIFLFLSYNILSFTSYLCVSMNKLVHTTMGTRLSIPTSLDYVGLRVFSFFFDDLQYGFLFPGLMVPPVCPRQSSCTPYYASIQKFIIMVPSAFSVSGNHLFTSRYLMVCCNFLKSSISVSCTRVQKKDTDFWIYEISLSDSYSSLSNR